MIICRGDISLQAPANISDQETEKACVEVEVCELPLPPHPNATLHENSSTPAEQLTTLVSDPHTQPSTAGKTVFKRSHQVTNTMLGSQNQQIPAQPEGSELLPRQLQQCPTLLSNTPGTPQDSTATMDPKLDPQQEEEIDVVGLETEEDKTTETKV